jgi:hypothetical protein
VLSAGIFEDLSPHARVATAVAPFVFAILMRLFLGKNRFTQVLLSLSTMWFAANVLLAPYSAGMRQDLMRLRSIFE